MFVRSNLEWFSCSDWQTLAPGKSKFIRHLDAARRGQVTKKSRRSPEGANKPRHIMPAVFKDYYLTLGVPRTAGAEEIRKAFRALARQYHPDVAVDKNKKAAEEKFKDVNEAYNVLSDPDKRSTYDLLGPDWKKPGNPRPYTGTPIFRTEPRRPRQSEQPQRPEQPEDYEVGGTGFSEFFEQVFSSRRKSAKTSETAETEKGPDVAADLMVTLEEAMNGAVRTITLRRKTRCPECKGGGGSGILGRSACENCDGKGQVTATQTRKVKIPPGVRDGQRLRVPGQGETKHEGGTPGDLYLRVRMANHPDFRVEEGHLCHDLDLAPWEAALGASISLASFDGPLNIKIPPGTQNGQRLRVRERGLPVGNAERGDLYIVARIQMPKAASERAKVLWEQLSREAAFNPRA
jgi:curved DNA-binding protein